MHLPAWQGNLSDSHPLCAMTLNLTLETSALHGRANVDVFVAWDRQGDIADYVRAGSTSSEAIRNSSAHGQQHQEVDLKFVDMFMALHADLFLLNPRSTFSWQVYVVRVVLRKTSVPVVRTNDMYMRQARSQLPWVSWTSIMNTFAKYG